MKSIAAFSSYIQDIVLLAESGLMFSNEDPACMVVCVKDMEMLSNTIRVHRIQKLNERYRAQRGKSK